MKKSFFSKIVVAVIVGTMVLSTMAVSAFADEPEEKKASAVTSLITITDQEQISHVGGALNFKISTVELTQEQRSAIASADCYFTLDTDYINGGAGYNKNGASDGWTNCIPPEVQEGGQWELTESGVISLPVEDYALSEDGSDSLQLQVWYTNGAFSLDKIELKDEAGSVIKTMAPADKYYVQGEGFGNNWTDIPMEIDDNGTYSLTLTDVDKGQIQFKVKTDSWDYSWDLVGFAYGADGNATVDVEEDDSTVVITFDGERVSVEVNPETEDPATEEPEGPSTGETVEYANYFGAQVYAMDNADWKWNSVSVDEFAADGTIVLTGNAADIADGSGSGAIGATGIQFFVGEQGQTDLGDKTISAKIAYVLKDEEGNVVEEGEVTIDTSKVDDAGKTVLIADVPLQGYGADWSEFTALGNFTLTATVSDIVITDPNAEEPTTEDPTTEEPDNGTPDLGDGVHAALIIALAFAALAVVATAAGKKFTADEK